MRKTLIAAAAIVAGLSTHAMADSHTLTVGVSWSNFQEERWKTDEAAIKGVLEAGGAVYVSADAQSSSAKQLADVESLIAQGGQRADCAGARRASHWTGSTSRGR